MKKRLLAVLLACIMLVACMAGCSSGGKGGASADTKAAAQTNASSDASTDTSKDAASKDVKLKGYKIALPVPDSGLTSFTILANNLKRLGELSNGTFIHHPSELSADAMIAFVESQIAAGVDGLIICPPADSILPTVTKLCEEAGVYWGICFRRIVDDNIRVAVEASPYYVGNCYEDEEKAGYDVMKFLGEKGMKNVAIISTTKGDTTGDAREAGMNRAAKEYGMKVVGEARGLTQASDATSATESFLVANPDLDCIFVVGTAATGAHEAVVKAIKDAGRADRVKMATIDFPNEMAANFESGVQILAYGLPVISIDPYLVCIKLVNAIQGYPLEDSFTSNSVAMTQVDSTEKAKEFASVVGNEGFKFFDDDFIKNKLFKWNNPELNQKALQQIIDSYDPTAK